MKVLQVSAYAPPHLGGVETVGQAIFDQMRDSHVQMTWLFSDVPALHPEPGTLRIRVFNAVEDLVGVPVPIPVPSAVSAMARLIAETDLIHVHDVMYLPCLLATLCAHRYHKPLVFTLHSGVWQVRYPRLDLRIAQAITLGTVGRYCLRRASAVACVNRALMPSLDRYSHGYREFIPNGIVQTFTEQEPLDSAYRGRRDALGLPQAGPIIVFAGRFVQKKGLPIIHELASAMPDVLFLMCGSGPDDPTSWALSNVRTLGQLPHRELREYFLASDLLLLPSTGEGFPLVIGEAMACGVQCAIYRETWLGHGTGQEYFVLLEGDRFADQIRGALPRGAKADWRESIAAFARDQWNWTEAGRRYRHLYKTAIDRWQSSGP